MTQTEDPASEPLKVNATNLQALSPQDQALVEAGKSILTNSVTNGRDYAKTMVPVCTGAITLYFAALKAVAPNKTTFTVFDTGFIILPIFAFIVSSIFYTFAYIPAVRSISLNSITDIKQTIEDLISKREPWNRAGLWTFIVATLLSGVGLLNAMLYWQVAPQR